MTSRAVAKLRFPLGEPFFDELKERQITEFRGTLMEETHDFGSGGRKMPTPVTSVLLTAFDPEASVIIEAGIDLDISYFKDQVKEKQEKILAYVKEQADKRGLTQKDGRWVPA